MTWLVFLTRLSAEWGSVCKSVFSTSKSNYRQTYKPIELFIKKYVKAVGELKFWRCKSIHCRVSEKSVWECWKTSNFLCYTLHITPIDFKDELTEVWSLSVLCWLSNSQNYELWELFMSNNFLKIKLKNRTEWYENFWNFWTEIHKEYEKQTQESNHPSFKLIHRLVSVKSKRKNWKTPIFLSLLENFLLHQLARVSNQKVYFDAIKCSVQFYAYFFYHAIVISKNVVSNLSEEQYCYNYVYFIQMNTRLSSLDAKSIFILKGL